MSRLLPKAANVAAKRLLSTRTNTTPLLVTLDAFDTIYQPRAPIPQQYADVAAKHGLTGLKVEDIEASFRRAFKSQRSRHPNYGRETGIGPEAWWAEIINKTFLPLLSSPEADDVPPTIPRGLVGALMHHFSSSEGYKVHPRSIDFLKGVRSRYPASVIGVVSNSDHRVIGILESLGIGIGRGPAGGREIARVDFVTLSYDVGFLKPDKRIFEAAKGTARGLLGLEEGQLLKWCHVGNDAVEDAAGAKDAGADVIVLVDKDLGERGVQVETKEGEEYVPEESDLKEWGKLWHGSVPDPSTTS